MYNFCLKILWPFKTYCDSLKLPKKNYKRKFLIDSSLLVCAIDVLIGEVSEFEDPSNSWGYSVERNGCSINDHSTSFNRLPHEEIIHSQHGDFCLGCCHRTPEGQGACLWPDGEKSVHISSSQALLWRVPEKSIWVNFKIPAKFN